MAEARLELSAVLTPKLSSFSFCCDTSLRSATQASFFRNWIQHRTQHRVSNMFGFGASKEGRHSAIQYSPYYSQIQDSSPRTYTQDSSLLYVIFLAQRHWSLQPLWVKRPECIRATSDAASSFRLLWTAYWLFAYSHAAYEWLAATMIATHPKLNIFFFPSKYVPPSLFPR